MEEQIRDYLKQVIQRIEFFEEECEKIQGQWDVNESGALEDQADRYREIVDNLSIVRSKLEYAIWRLYE